MANLLGSLIGRDAATRAGDFMLTPSLNTTGPELIIPSSPLLTDMVAPNPNGFLGGLITSDKLGVLDFIPQHVEGGNGADNLSGRKGADTIIGGLGTDTAFGGDGDDTIFGDLPLGNAADQNRHNSVGDGDVLFGGDGKDMIYGNGGNDTAFGGNGSDRVSGNDGNDVAFGGAGNDFIGAGWYNPERGNDTFFGGAGNDLIYGGAGKDVLLGGDDNDMIDGGAGRDIIDGGKGNDTLVGGPGFLEGDTFKFHADDGNDTVLEFDARWDKIDLSEIDGIDGIEDIRVFDDAATGETVVDYGSGQIRIDVVDRLDYPGNADDELTSANFVF